eukprot:scaffold5310_cov378-Prasinococcus_capsulatus_cf.AAC.5
MRVRSSSAPQLGGHHGCAPWTRALAACAPWSPGSAPRADPSPSSRRSLPGTRGTGARTVSCIAPRYSRSEGCKPIAPVTLPVDGRGALSDSRNGVQGQAHPERRAKVSSWVRSVSK